MKILQITEGFDLALGGTTAYVQDLSKSLLERDIEVHVSALADGEDDLEPWGDSIEFKPLRPLGPQSAGFSLGAFPKLMAVCDVNILHQHGLWLDIYRVAGDYAKQNDIPLIISLHGMLEPWALKRSKWKKRIAWFLWQRREIQRAKCLHVATQREADNIRKLGIETPIAVIPNGISMDDELGNASDAQGIPELVDKKYFLSLGRLHPVKGLDMLARAWANLCKEHRDWLWVIAGPDEDGYRGELEHCIDLLGIRENVLFVGQVDGEKKESLIRNSSFLVLPSHLESFGIVVLEALKAGRPAMVSQNCPWEGLVDKGCGWWVNFDPESWRSSLENAIAMDEKALNDMGERGKQWVKESFSQEQTLSQMLEVYKWMVEGGDRPEVVV